MPIYNLEMLDAWMKFGKADERLCGERKTIFLGDMESYRTI
jgi:hypothetical protein